VGYDRRARRQGRGGGGDNDSCGNDEPKSPGLHPPGHVVEPSSDAPVPDVSQWLYPLLLTSLGWLTLAGCVAALGTWWLRRRHGVVLDRCQEFFFGATSRTAAGEPTGRRFLRLSFGVLWIIDAALQAGPDVPAGFRRDVLSPALASSPDWWADAVAPLSRLWTLHPVVADATTVWVQLGLGVLLLVGGRGALNTLAVWATVAWSLLVWFAGEGMGGLLSPGAGWLTGAPGAVLVYLLAALLLLVPWRWWDSGRAAGLARISVGLWLLLGACLQAIPWEGFWTGDGLAMPFAEGASTPQPSLLKEPISVLARASALHPAAINAAILGLLLVVGAALCVSRATSILVLGLTLCGATWWLAQDFGVLESVATDPNTALPLGLLLGCALPHWRSIERAAPADRMPTSAPRRSALHEASSVGFAGLGVAALVAPITVVGLLLGPADAAALASDSAGGLVQLPARSAPTFSLTDQNGRTVTQASLRGKLTLVTFLDPVCSDDCPVIANQLAVADRQLGPLADRVEIIAIDSNPVFTNVSDVAAFTTAHGLDDLPNWHFLAGPARHLQDVTAAYGIAVQVPTVGMIEHDQGIYFVGPDGKTRAYLGDGADPDLTGGYAAAISREIRSLLARMPQ
jgi:cytochrome oxidase Cu insertion factor (SCO1/SenC/PrrC family)